LWILSHIINKSHFCCYFYNQIGIVLPAVVPGGIYSDLIRNNVIGHPFFGTNDVNYRWVGDNNWNYAGSFTINSQLLYNDIFIVFEGIDTVAQIFINDHFVGTTENMFVCYRFYIKKYVTSLENTLRVRILSSIQYGFAKHENQLNTKHYPIPPLCTPPVIHGSCHVNYLRKMQASFGWDWGPAFPSSGIWKSVGLEIVDRPVLKEIMAWTHKEYDQWSIKVTTIFENFNQDSVKADLKCFLDHELIYNQQLHLTSFNDSSYKHTFVHRISSTTLIKPWWPNGVGFYSQNGLTNLEQKLYKLKCSANSPLSPSIKSTKTKSIGFRTIKLIQRPLSNNANSFYFEINGRPLFAKGSNWIPAMIFPELQDKEYIKYLLTSAKKANMNMLRVWGGGVYESDYFYDLADKYGILIWQDFMFAVALYPTDDEFLSSVAVEVKQQVERLQSHPCIAIWSSNNENEAAIASKWWPQIFKFEQVYKQDYVKLYIDTIKKVVDSIDPHTPFVSSSPSNGIETTREGWVAQNPSDNRYGDVHHYDYSSDSWNWRNYPEAKFVSEYGYQSYPSLRSLQSVLPSEQLVYPLSGMLKHRQHHDFGDQEIEAQILRKMKLPKYNSKESLNQFIYLSQISQAMAIKVQTEFYRRNRDFDPNTGLGMTMGALYWQLNDVWQAPSWSSIEFGGVWKMLHYYAVNFFSPLLMSPFIEHQDLCITVVNDCLNGINLKVSILLYELNSFTPSIVSTLNVSVNGSSAEMIFKRPFYQIFQPGQCLNIDNCIIRVVYENPKANIFGDNFLLLGEPKHAYQLSKPNIRLVNITHHGNSQLNTFDIIIHSDAIAMFVWADFKLDSKIRGQFSDNGFMLFSSYKSLAFQSEFKVDINDIARDIVFLSLSDVLL